MPISSDTAFIGVDFTSAPGPRKPITVAHGRLQGALLRLERVDTLPGFAGFEALLAAPGPWLGAFDFPFGLPRAFVDAQALGTDADAVIGELHRRCGTRMGFRALVDAWGNDQPPGQRLLHRRCDTAMAGLRSTSPLQTRYVPVGFMYFEGLSRLVAAGVTIPRLRAGDAARVALEGYPGLVAHGVLGARSYKNDKPGEGGDRLIARKDLIEALEQGRTRWGLRVKLTHAQRDALAADASGDRLDAVLCLLQAAWAGGQPDFGLPPQVDAVEGWIVGAAVR